MKENTKLGKGKGSGVLLNNLKNGFTAYVRQSKSCDGSLPNYIIMGIQTTFLVLENPCHY